MSKVLTVKEVAELMGISKQAVYKKMEKDFKPYVVLVENQKCLKSEVLKQIHSTKQSTKVEHSTSLKSLEKLVEILEKENEKKQQYIDSLQQQLEEERIQRNELIENLTELSSQVGTTLQAITQESLADKLIEGKKLMEEQPTEQNVSVPTEPEKKGFFKKFFG